MKTAEEILLKHKLIYHNGFHHVFAPMAITANVSQLIEAMEEYRSQPSDVSDEIKDIIDSILKFDFNESLVIKGEYFNTIQRDLKKAIGQIKPTILNTDNEWIDINFLLPETGVTVLCKLSKDIGLGTTEKKLYRMKYNGKWNDYDHLVTHWKIIGKNKIKVHYAWEIKPTIEGEKESKDEAYNSSFCKCEHPIFLQGVCEKCGGFQD